MKNIRLYEAEVDYTSEKDTHEYPTVSYCKENDVVYYLTNNASLFEFVDLGLPSGLKWATCNVGATNPEEFGLYFAWGETQGYTAEDVQNGVKQFTWSDYKFSSDENGTTMTKYNDSDGLVTLESADDAATAVDSGCRMPTKEEFEELIANTASEWVADYNGTSVAGRLFTSNSNGNSIFVPAAGGCALGSLDGVGQAGLLCSSSLYTEGPTNAFCLGFNSGVLGVNGGNRGGGFSIRPVKK